MKPENLFPSLANTAHQSNLDTNRNLLTTATPPIQHLYTALATTLIYVGALEHDCHALTKRINLWLNHLISISRTIDDAKLMWLKANPPPIEDAKKGPVRQNFHAMHTDPDVLSGYAELHEEVRTMLTHFWPEKKI